ncbi:AlpA family transcriptional regulator [Synechococcus sp. CS-1331]|nr:AlpA family transcriptional regulator [Synechococcus sp. CS-1331]
MISTNMFLRLPQVKQYTCLSKSSIYRLIDKGEFPKQVSLGSRSVVWVKSQIDEWCLSKIASAQY